jgi:pilus assembly protein Flp/PilA
VSSGPRARKACRFFPTAPPAALASGRGFNQEVSMEKFISAIKTFAADDGGVTAIEYGLIAALVGVAMVAAATTLGGKISDAFTYVAGKIVTPAS